MNARHWIQALNLEPHPEGGYYRETYRSELVLPVTALPDFDGERHVSTAIYYLLEAGDCSRLHRIKSDELWHFYTGTRLAVYSLSARGFETFYLGPEDGFQVCLPAGSWFGARALPSLSQPELEPYALAGCTVAPGFDFDDFEFANRALLEAEFGPLPEQIQRLL